MDPPPPDATPPLASFGATGFGAFFSSLAFLRRSSACCSASRRRIRPETVAEPSDHTPATFTPQNGIACTTKRLQVLWQRVGSSVR